VALGDQFGCGFLINLGGCRHLDGLEQWMSICMSSWPSPGNCEGSCTFPGEEPKGNSSGLLVSLSYLTCG